MTSLSLCVIAKDEEALLPGCLESVRGVVDEIVLVDTGSRDRTAALAREAGARVFDFPWRDDFAAARNASLAHATGGFVLVLDADERLAPGAGRALRGALVRPAFDVGLLPIHEAARLDADPAAVVSGEERDGVVGAVPRLLRNEDGLAFRGVVHETVDAWAERRGSRLQRVPADLVHLGGVLALRKARGKSERNLALLRRRCELEPESLEPLAYLAGELLQLGDDAGARAAAERGWELAARLPAGRSVHRLAALRALLALRAGQPAVALESAAAAERRQGEHLDFHYLRGCALEQQALAAPPGEARRALALAAAEALARAEAARRPRPLEVFAEGADSHAVQARLGAVLLAAGEPKRALGAFEAALAEAPDDRRALLGRAEARLELGDPASALKQLERLLGERPDAWTLASAAALALGSRADAALLLARADERLQRRFEGPWRRERHAGLRLALG